MSKNFNILVQEVSEKVKRENQWEQIYEIIKKYFQEPKEFSFSYRKTLLHPWVTPSHITVRFQRTRDRQKTLQESMEVREGKECAGPW